MALLKKILIIALTIGLGILNAQDAMHNYGQISIIGEANVGIHLNLINDGPLEQNMGLLGFYSNEDKLMVSGTISPSLYDAEFQVDQGLELQNEIYVNNNANIISGNIYTQRTNLAVRLNFMNDAFYTGDNDGNKVDGYAAMTNKEFFTFPIGSEDRLRPLTIESVAINPFSKSAYFNENPNDSKILNTSFSTASKSSQYLAVSIYEFWKLESSLPSKVTLTWDELSNVSALGDFLSDLKVVGWDKSRQEWVDLGNTGVQGDIYYGSVTSDYFIPNQYEILTLGGNDDALETFETISLDNYYLTPNADGTNDQLEISGIEQSPNNTIQIFNRYGQLVFSKNNYQGEFYGQSNVTNVVQRPKGLESGIYFYICTLHDLRQKHQGYLYLSN